MQIDEKQRKIGDVCFVVSFFILPSVRSSVRPFICPSVHPSIHQSVRRPFICPSVRSSVCSPSVRPFICLSVRPFICLSVRPSVHLFVHLSVRASVLPFICPSVRSSVCPAVRPSVRSSIRSYSADWSYNGYCHHRNNIRLYCKNLRRWSCTGPGGPVRTCAGGPLVRSCSCANTCCVDSGRAGELRHQRRRRRPSASIRLQQREPVQIRSPWKWKNVIHDLLYLIDNYGSNNDNICSLRLVCTFGFR